jgi:hypothetical protein
MINLFKKTKTETIQPCGVNRMVIDQPVSFNDVFKSAHNELNKIVKLKKLKL